MKRRAFLFGAFTPCAMSEERVPTDELALNRFAEKYNTYVEALRQGIIDLKAWQRVRAAWSSMAG